MKETALFTKEGLFGFNVIAVRAVDKSFSFKEHDTIWIDVYIDDFLKSSKSGHSYIPDNQPELNVIYIYYFRAVSRTFNKLFVELIGLPEGVKLIIQPEYHNIL